MPELYYPKESYALVGVCMEVHRTLGHGFLEVVYKVALEWEFTRQGIPFEREKPYPVSYKNVLLPHVFQADFVAYGCIILEIKAKSLLTDEHLAQTMNYLAISRNKLGLLVNFGRGSLEHKRIVL
jgi:GxxExxY protein